MDLHIERINELARKKKTAGLSPEEEKEQALLRQQYISAVRKNLRSQLDNIDMLEPDGTITHLADVVKRED